MAKRGKKKRRRDGSKPKPAAKRDSPPAKVESLAAGPQPTALANNNSNVAPSAPVARPGGLTARRLLGVAALSLTVATVVSGLALLFPYDSAQPHEAMKELLAVTPLGAFWHSLHRLGASGLLLCLGGYLVACLLSREPQRRAPYFVSVALLVIAVGMSCTGEGLGGDHVARAKIEATTALGASLPLVGSLQRLLRGGDEVEKTTKRFFFLHVMPLPLPLLGVALLLLRLRMSAAAEREPADEQSGMSSRQRDLAVSLGALAAVTLLAAFWPVELGSAVARAVPAKAPWYLVAWQEMDSYSPLSALLFLAVLLIGLLAVPKASSDSTRGGRWWAVGTALVGGGVAAGAVWWWRDPSYGAPAAINPATIALFGVGLCGALIWRLTASAAAALRAGIAASLAALVVFATVGLLLRGPGWSLGWHPKPTLEVSSAAQTAERAAAAPHGPEKARP